MNFEQTLCRETARMSREFAIYGGAIGLVLGVAATLILQAVLA